MKSRLSLAASVLSLALTACGGGGGTSSGVVTVPAQPVAPATVATSAPTSAPATAPQSTAQITLTMPPQQTAALARSPQYVSPNAGLFQSTVVSVDGSTTLPNGTPAVIATTLSSASGGNCKRDFNELPPGHCVVTIQAPTGIVAYQFDLFDKAGGSRLATLNPTFTMPATGLTAQLKGIPAFVTIFTPPDLTYGVRTSASVGFDVRDATAAIIFGPAPFSVPFTLCDSDTSGHTSLSVGSPGSPASRCVDVGDIAATVSLDYDGAQIPPFTITASGSTLLGGGSSSSVYPEPPFVLSGTVGGEGNRSVLTFTSSPQTKSFTVTQTGHTGPFGSTFGCGSGATATATVATTDNITFDVTAQHSGTCVGTITGLRSSYETIEFHVP